MLEFSSDVEFCLDFGLDPAGVESKEPVIHRGCNTGPHARAVLGSR